MKLHLKGPVDPISATIQLPASKSISNRALIIRSLAGGAISNLSDAEDTRILDRLLADEPATMFCGLGGTTLRFVLAWACVQKGRKFEITGEPELLKRPHDELVRMLRECGARIVRTDTGFQVDGSEMSGGTVTVEDGISSQYLSAIMLVAPYMRNGLRVHRKGLPVSQPYVDMTTRMMREAGAEVRTADGLIEVLPTPYSSASRSIPADWSAASFFFCMAASRPGTCFVFNDLGFDKLQGDEAIARMLSSTVSVHGTDPTRIVSVDRSYTDICLNLRDTPDLFQPLAFLAATTDQHSVFTGLETLQFKESDRIQTTEEVLRKLGAETRSDENSFTILGGVKNYKGDPLPTFNDHRLAMSLSLLTNRFQRISIQDPLVVQKSFPDYWEELAKVGFQVTYE